jgi:taurine dioxygenase
MNDGLRITKLSSSIGARVEGIDPSAEIPGAWQDQLRQALWEQHVLVFPGHDVGMEEQVRLVSCFGDVQPMPVFKFLGERNPAIAVDYKGGGVVNRDGHAQRAVTFNNRPQKVLEFPNWHTDVSFTPEVPLVGSLRGEVIPPVGGDTCFASLCAAYEALSPVMRTLLVNLKAVHSPPAGYKEAINIGQYGDDAEARFDAAYPPREHPVVVEHPYSRRPALFVNPGFTVRLVGMTDAESVTILRFLYNHIADPRFVYRHHWTAGDIVVWDELVCLHLAPTDFQPHDRRLVRIIGGTVAPTPAPVGV